MAKRWLFLEIAKAWSAAFGFFSLHFPRSPELLQWGQDAEIPTYPFFPFMDLFMNLSVCLFEHFDTLCSQLCVAASTRYSLSALSREVFPLCAKWISFKILLSALQFLHCRIQWTAVLQSSYPLLPCSLHPLAVGSFTSVSCVVSEVALS